MVPLKIIFNVSRFKPRSIENDFWQIWDAAQIHLTRNKNNETYEQFLRYLSMPWFSIFSHKITNILPLRTIDMAPNFSLACIPRIIDNNRNSSHCHSIKNYWFNKPFKTKPWYNSAGFIMMRDWFGKPWYNSAGFIMMRDWFGKGCLLCNVKTFSMKSWTQVSSIQCCTWHKFRVNYERLDF